MICYIHLPTATLRSEEIVKKTHLHNAVIADPKQNGWIEATVQFMNLDEESRYSFASECMDHGAVGSSEPATFLNEKEKKTVVCEACGESSRLNVFFPNSMGMEEVLLLLDGIISSFLKRIPDFSARVLQCRAIRKEDWATDWRNTFPPEKIGKRIWTVPPWESPTLPPDTIPIILEPGLAFGTGKHATTRQCIQFLEEIASDRTSLPDVFLDVGCGSGILSIAAASLGVKKVLALEIDPEALPVVRKNVRRNGLCARIQFVNGTPECCRGPFEWIAANLTATILLQYSRLLPLLLAEGGFCILSGILRSEKQEILKTYYRSGLHPIKEKVDGVDDWNTILFQKSSCR